MELRKQKEREFHNRLRKGIIYQRWSPEIEQITKLDPLWNNMKFYSVERKSRKFVLDWYAKNCKGKKVLDYGCGNGDDSFIIAKIGAKEVIGIDISEISIKNCTRRAINGGLDKIASFYVSDVESLHFDDNYFDIISEYGVLHHINLNKGLFEIARVLKPDGKVICTEALGHNPFIRLYRKMTPYLRTPWEASHILCKSHFGLVKDFFDKIEINFFHLCVLGAVPFRNTRFFSRSLTILEKMDSIILKFPFIRWQAWQVVFILSEPRK